MKGLSKLAATAAIIAAPNIGHGQGVEQLSRQMDFPAGVINAGIDHQANIVGHQSSIQRDSKGKVKEVLGERKDQATLDNAGSSSKHEQNHQGLAINASSRNGYPQSYSLPRGGDRNTNMKYRQVDNSLPIVDKKERQDKFLPYETVPTVKSRIVDAKNSGDEIEAFYTWDVETVIHWTKRATSRVQSKERHQRAIQYSRRSKKAFQEAYFDSFDEDTDESLGA